MPFNGEEEARGAQAEAGRRGVFPRRVRVIRDSYEVDAKATIEKAIRNLMELAEEAHRLATSKYQPTEDRQRWARIAAYIYQTINSLAKTHDSQTFSERLEELTRRVDELTKEVGASGEEG
jgi:hypothetical protein